MPADTRTVVSAQGSTCGYFVSAIYSQLSCNVSEHFSPDGSSFTDLRTKAIGGSMAAIALDHGADIFFRRRIPSD